MKEVRQTRLGARSELLACVWLINQGYEVFRNVVATGPIDIVAVKDGQSHFFDVKTGWRQKSTGEISYARLSIAQRDLGVKAIVVLEDGHIEIDEKGRFKDDMRGKECPTCGTKFDAGYYGKKVYCSNACKPKPAKVRETDTADMDFEASE